MMNFKCFLFLIILASSLSILADTPLPKAEEIAEFNSNPARENTNFKDFKIERKDLEDIIKAYFQVSKDQWMHNYSHVAMEDRTGTIKLKDGRTIQWMVRPGGLATLTFPDNIIIYLAKEETKNVFKNVFKDIPYAESNVGKRQLVDEKHLFVMQAALKPGQQVPQHNANSNVHLLVIEGQVIVTMDGKDTVASKGDLLPVAFKTLMSIRNSSKENASFLIIKSPNPSEMKP